MATDPEGWVYGDYAPDSSRHDLVGLKADWILRRLPPLQRPAVLDFGSGEGRYLHLIRGARPEAKLVGVDVRAPKTATNYEFHQLPGGSRLPFSADEFDIVVSCDVLEHVENVTATLDEIRRVLRPGGLFIGFVPLEGGAGPHSFCRVFDAAIFLDAKDHLHAFSRRQMLTLMGDRFTPVALAYSYHLLGSTLDAAFFASFKFPLIGKHIELYWRGQENAVYRRDATPTLLGRVVGFANRMAYWESRLLHRCPLGASGLHFCLQKT